MCVYACVCVCVLARACVCVSDRALILPGKSTQGFPVKYISSGGGCVCVCVCARVCFMLAWEVKAGASGQVYLIRWGGLCVCVCLSVCVCFMLAWEIDARISGQVHLLQKDISTKRLDRSQFSDEVCRQVQFAQVFASLEHIGWNTAYYGLIWNSYCYRSCRTGGM